MPTDFLSLGELRTENSQSFHLLSKKGPPNCPELSLEELRMRKNGSQNCSELSPSDFASLGELRLNQGGPPDCPELSPSDFASLGELRTENSQSYHQLRQRRQESGGTKLAKSVSFSDCQATPLAYNKTLTQVEEKPKAPRRKRLALATSASHRSSGESKSTVDGSGSSAVQMPSETTSEMNSSYRVQNCDVVDCSKISCAVQSDKRDPSCCVGPTMRISSDLVNMANNPYDRVCGDVKDLFYALIDHPGKSSISDNSASAKCAMEISSDLTINSLHNVQKGDSISPSTVQIDRSRNWVKSDTPTGVAFSEDLMPSDPESKSSVANIFHNRVQNGDVRTSINALADPHGKWVKSDTTANYISDTRDTNDNISKVNQKCIAQSACRATTNAELLPNISVNNTAVDTVSESSNAKISAADTYVNLPGTCISISNFVEELAVRNASKDNPSPVIVPDRFVCDTLNSNGSFSSANAPSELPLKSNARRIQLESSPESSNVEFSGISAANCIREFAVRSDQKDTMISMRGVDYSAHFTTECGVMCDLKDNVVSVCDMDCSQNGGHSDTLICDATSNHRDQEIVVCADHLPSLESQITNGNDVTFIEYSPGDVFNSKHELSDLNNEEFINIHLSDHIRYSYDSLNINKQVNEPDSFFTPAPSDTICSLNGNEPSTGNGETLDLDDNLQIPIPISIELLKQQLLLNIFDISSENRSVEQKSGEFLQKTVRTDCRECLPSPDSTHCCLNLLNANVNPYAILTELTSLTQQSEFRYGIERRKRSILDMNPSFMSPDDITNNNSAPDVESYLQKLIQHSPFIHMGFERHLRVWNASFVQNICRHFISSLDFPLKLQQRAMNEDRDACANDDRSPVRGKEQDRCPDASLRMLLPSGPSKIVTVRGPDLHTGGTDTPQYVSDNGGGRNSPHIGRDLDATTPNPGIVCDGLFGETNVGAGEIRANYPIYDSSGRAKETCTTRVVSPEDSGCVDCDPDIPANDGDLCRETYQEVDEVRNFSIYDSSGRTNDTCTSRVVSSEDSGYVECDPGTSSAMLSNVDVGVYDGVFSRETYVETGEIRTNYSRQIYDICRFTNERCSSKVASPEISGLDENSLIHSEKHSDTKICISESTPLKLESAGITNGGSCPPVINGYLKNSSEKLSGVENYESVGLSASESSVHLDSSEPDTFCPVINGYLRDSSEKDSNSDTCTLIGLEPSTVQQISSDASKAENYSPPTNGYLDSSGDESYVESLLLTGELTEELISTTLRTDTELSGTLDEEDVTSTISLISDCDTTDGLLKNVIQDSGVLEMPDISSEVIHHNSVCSSGGENEIPFDGVKNRIKMFENNSPDVSIVAPDISAIAPEEKLPQTRRKSDDKGKNSMIPSLKKRRSITFNENHPEPVKTKIAIPENKRRNIAKTSDAETKKPGKASQNGLRRRGQNSEKRVSESKTETSFDCCIIREVKSDYKCFDNSEIEHLPDSNLCSKIQQRNAITIANQSKAEDIPSNVNSEMIPTSNLNPPQGVIENVKSDYNCFDDGIRRDHILNSKHLHSALNIDEDATEQFEETASEVSTSESNSNPPQSAPKILKCFNDSEMYSEYVLNSNLCSTVLQTNEQGTSQWYKSEVIIGSTEFNSKSPQNTTKNVKCLNVSKIDDEDKHNSNMCPPTQQINEQITSQRCKSEEILTAQESDSNPPQTSTALKPVPNSRMILCENDVFNLSSSLHDFDGQFRTSVEGRSLHEVSSSTGVQGQCGLHSRCASLPLVVGQVQPSNFARRNYLIKNKDVATSGRSRIPRKQVGGRAAHSSSKPVRPPMWLSKAELTQEIQRLGNLCEARTKELNRLKMETKHVSVGFDAFAALFKYMVEDLNALSVPMLSADLQKTLKQLELAKQDLAYYEREVEEMKAHHCQELNDLSNKLFEVFQGEVTELSAKHQEEMNHLNHDHQKQIENLTTNLNSSSAEVIAQHEELVTKLQQELINQREELQLFQEREILDLEEKHSQSTKTLQEHIEQLQKKCAELKQHSMGMEDAMRKDTDSKLQWVTARKVDLEKEVESLKAVLEMKNKELHTIRIQNLEMEKQLEELPLAREKIKALQARAEDLEALMIEKTKLERKLSNENHQIRETYEKESKVNRRLSMENEELQWRLRQAEQSIISGSFSEVAEYPEDEENGTPSPAKSPSKSPGPHVMSRSVFFTFVDKEDHSSPKSQYKKITPGFSSSYKTSPAKSSKSPRSKSHSEPPMLCSTPRSSKASSKQKSTPKRQQRSGSECGKPATEETGAGFLSVTASMASSVSSESSVFEHKERILEEHKDQIMHSLEILREQRIAESTASEEQESVTLNKEQIMQSLENLHEQQCNLEGIGSEEPELVTSNDTSPQLFNPEDMSRSSEFSDPKTYYHMTFPVLKEPGMPDGDMDDSDKVTSHDDVLVAQLSHSKSNGNGNVDNMRDTDRSESGAMSQHIHVKPSLSNDDDCKQQTEPNVW